MTQGELFAGIGGFGLAGRWAGIESVFQVEWNNYCQKILKKNFPNAALYSDIREFDGTPYRGAIDIISGGFPCQPYSTAGKRLGKADDRHLWPETLRVIREVAPRWVVGENVRGLVNWSGGLVFDEVQADLEAAGYEVFAAILPAASVNAPHRRDRIWFVAYDASESRRTSGQSWECKGMESTTSNCQIKDDGRSKRKQNVGQAQQFGNGSEQDAHTNPQSQQVRTGLCPDESGRKWRGRPGYMGSEDVANANVGRLEGVENQTEWQFTTYRNAWSEFPTQSPLCGRNDGVSAGLDKAGRISRNASPKSSKKTAAGRQHRIAALGNAIVPQVAYQIFKAIREYENQTPHILPGFPDRKG